MKKSTKAVLLSALVFPGMGHFHLKKYYMAILLAGASGWAMYYIFSNVMAQAFKISEAIQSGSVPLDNDSITRLLLEQSQGSSLSIVSTIFFIIWIVSIVDSYRQGRNLDNANKTPATKKTRKLFR